LIIPISATPIKTEKTKVWSLECGRCFALLFKGEAIKGWVVVQVEKFE
jgi:hypothetical protein